MSEIPGPPPNPSSSRTYSIIRETWLTRKPREGSLLVAALTTFALTLGSILYWQNTFNAANWIPASAEAVFSQGQYWRLWTTLFAHADAGHLLSNAFLFSILGYFLYGHFGFRLFPWAAFFWGGVANLCVLSSYAPNVLLIGASGIVYWMGGAWLILYFFLSRQKNLTQRILRSLGVGILLFMPAETFEPNVSYRTHFAGFLLGLLAGGLHYLRHRKTFLAAEVHEWIIETEDSGDELPPPGGFQ